MEKLTVVMDSPEENAENVNFLNKLRACPNTVDAFVRTPGLTTLSEFRIWDSCRGVQQREKKIFIQTKMVRNQSKGTRCDDSEVRPPLYWVLETQ